jgi:signal transduction histidine kinase
MGGKASVSRQPSTSRIHRARERQVQGGITASDCIAMSGPGQRKTQAMPRVLFPLAAVLFWSAMCLAMAGPQAPGEELRTVAAVRGLTVEQTQQKMPVRLRGVVTFFDETLYSHFIQDETAGIYLQFPTNTPLPALAPGQVVEVSGVASEGEYAPVVLVDTVTAAGERPLPPAKPVSYEQLASGAEDSQFVELTGIVRYLRKSDTTPFFEIELVTGGGRFLVLSRELPAPRPDELVDSTVRVRGVCATKFNHQRQLFAIRLMVPRPDDLEIESPATQKPYEMPARPVGSLLQFTPHETYGHRVKIAGTVTYFDAGSTLYLQDAGRGVQVQTKSTEPLAVGDQVEVLGFVGQGEYTPLLQDAVYRKTAAGRAVAPINVNTDGALTGNFDCELVRLSARVIDRTRKSPESFLLLQDGQLIFQASLKQTAGQDSFALAPNGSLVGVTGVCRIEPGEWHPGNDWRAQSFKLLLRSPADVAVLELPPWWTLKKVLWIAGVLGFVTLAAFGWVAVLRRQVAERTGELEVQIQKRQLAERRRDIEQERARVAHDLHDDLGGRLTEVNMLTTLATSPTTSAQEKARYLGDLSETARRMVTSLDEIVWAVNPRNDTIASLASYFSSYAQRLLDLASVACGLDVAEELPDYPLDPKFRQELFFAFKEALTNIVRHAGATQVWLRMAVRDGCLLVELADNGRGFDPRQQPAGSDGITNMNERLKALGGACEIASAAAKGTTIRFRAPLPKSFL